MLINTSRWRCPPPCPSFQVIPRTVVGALWQFESHMTHTAALGLLTQLSWRLHHLQSLQLGVHQPWRQDPHDSPWILDDLGLDVVSVRTLFHQGFTKVSPSYASLCDSTDKPLSGTDLLGCRLSAIENGLQNNSGLLQDLNAIRWGREQGEPWPRFLS